MVYFNSRDKLIRLSVEKIVYFEDRERGHYTKRRYFLPHHQCSRHEN